MDCTYYLCAAWRPEFIRVIPQLYTNPEEAWAVSSREKLHLLKVVPSAGGWLFDEYLDHPEVPGTGVATILMSLATLDDAVRRCLKKSNRPQAPARC